ncbi:Transposase [Shigella dysenteriae 1617]|uniref:Transposase n=1 Tax=Shigella dysenteriae 1617 TaxID=754093 RepID=A0A0A6ZS08_SHIDY|nr:Transposase [Shigella dysenteriae 1617]
MEFRWQYTCSTNWKHHPYNTKTGGVLAYTFGPRTDETCRELLALLTPFNIGMITSDDWGQLWPGGAEG